MSRYDFQQQIGGQYLDNVGDFQGVGVIARWKHVANATWSRDAWQATLSNRYTSGYNDYDLSLIHISARSMAFGGNLGRLGLPRLALQQIAQALRIQRSAEQEPLQFVALLLSLIHISTWARRMLRSFGRTLRRGAKAAASIASFMNWL